MSEVNVHFEGDTTLVAKRQVAVTPLAATDCPHFWKTLRTGDVFAAPPPVQKFFLKPFDCAGNAIADTGINPKDAASASAIVVTLLGPSGGKLATTTPPFGVTSLDGVGDGSFIVSYQGDVCGPAQLSVAVYGVDVEASPHRLQFTDDPTTAADCACGGAVTLSVVGRPSVPQRSRRVPQDDVHVHLRERLVG